MLTFFIFEHLRNNLFFIYFKDISVSPFISFFFSQINTKKSTARGFLFFLNHLIVRYTVCFVIIVEVSTKIDSKLISVELCCRTTLSTIMEV